MFLMGSLLFGVLGVSIPVIIHLLHRQKTVPLQWGAMMFLKESVLQQRRRKSVDHWLLMLVRMAILGFLAFLLARPLWIHGKYNPLTSNLSTDVALVIDHSLSTGRHAGDQTLFQQELGLTDKVAGLLKPSDTLSVVLAEHRPRAFTPLPQGARDLRAVQEKLRQLKPGLSDCSIPEAIQTAREVLNRGRNVKKLIVVLSDEQRSNWKTDDPSAWRQALGGQNTGPDHLPVHELGLAPDTGASNVSVGGITITPPLVGLNRPAQITATISNSGPHDVAMVPVKLLINGREIENRPLPNLASGQSVTVRFDTTFTVAGSNWVKVQADVVDALAADNEAVAAANVWARLPVLIIDGQLTTRGRYKSSDFLQAAMQPVDPLQAAGTLIQTRVIGVADSAAAKLDDYFVVVLNDCPELAPQPLSHLADYARAGHGVWVVLGPRSQRSFIDRDLARAGLFSAETRSLPRTATEPASLELRDPKNPMVSLLAEGERNALAGAVTQQWWPLKPNDPDDRVVLAATSGDPLIFERPIGRNGGRVAVWCTSADGGWNNWPLMPNFVPLVNETINHLSSGQTRGLNNGELEAGEPIVWTGPASPAVQSVSITLPDDTTDAGKKPTLANGRYEFRYNNAFSPGLYTLHFTPTGIQPQPVYYGVGIDRRETDPNTLSTQDIDWLKTGGFLDPEKPKITPDDLAGIINRENKGTELWKWLAGLVLASLVFETFMTYRMASFQKKVNVAGAGLVSSFPAGQG